MRTRSTVLGFAVLTILLTAGAAQSLSGSNTVFTDDIVDGQVGYGDLKDGAVGSRKIFDNSVTGADINESSIPGLRKVYFARVMFVFPQGNETSHEVRLYGSEPKTGVSVTLVESPLEFKVTFPFNVTACAPSVTAGTVPGLVSPETTLNNVNPPVAYTTLKTGTPQEVSVKFKRDNGELSGDNFSLTLVCP